MESDLAQSAGASWPWPGDVPAEALERDIDGWAWALRLPLAALRRSAERGRTITLPNLLRFFDRRWSDYVAAIGHEPPHGRSRGRAVLESAYHNIRGLDE